jgi:aminobenzoyl-glutamate utilization protein A
MRRAQAHPGPRFVGATYVGLGADLAGPHHTPGFDFDESALAPGVDFLEQLIRTLP